MKLIRPESYLYINQQRIASADYNKSFPMNVLDKFFLHYLDKYFYIIYKEDESCFNDTMKNVYPAGEI